MNPSIMQSDRRSGKLQLNDQLRVNEVKRGITKTLRQIKVTHEHDKMIDEIVTNNYSQVKGMLAPVLREKLTSNPI